MDEADHDTCVWGQFQVVSHRWSQEHAKPYLKAGNFSMPEADPIYMQPGDVLFHEIRLLHGSRVNTSPNLRRIVYCEFRTASEKKQNGPHTPEYIPIKQNALRACLEQRKQADYIPSDEVPSVYVPPLPFDQFDDLPSGGLDTYRNDRQDFWRE